VNLEQIYYPNELANHQAIQEATDLLHITKSGLSQSISQLEAEVEVGVRLFDRSRHGTRLTKEGQDLLPIMKRMLSTNIDLMNYSQTCGKTAGSKPSGWVIPTRCSNRC